MPNVTVTREVKAPLAGVWASWDDFANIYKFNPNLSHSSLLEDGKEKAGLGARRVCEFKDGKNWIHEEIVDYTPQSKIKIHVYEGTLPLKESFATISFKSLGEGKTLVTFSMDLPQGLVCSDFCWHHS